MSGGLTDDYTLPSPFLPTQSNPNFCGPFVPVLFTRIDCCWLRWDVMFRVLLLGCLMGAYPAHAQDHITERAWLEDPTGQMTLAQVQQQAPQPFQGTLSRGFGAGVLWLRLRIDPSIGIHAPGSPAVVFPGNELVLRIRPAYLDEVKVFDPLADGGVAGVVGDHYHPRHDALLGTDFLLPIARGSAPRELWLRLSSVSTRQIDVVVLPRNQSSARNLRQSLGASLYLSVVLGLMVWGGIGRVLQRERAMGAFALMQLASALYGLSSLGVLRVFWPLAWSAGLLDLLGSVFAITAVLSSIWFHVRFLREFQPAAWAMGLLYVVLGVALANLALLCVGQVAWALQSNMWLVLWGPLACLACAMTGRRWKAGSGLPALAISQPLLVAFYVLLLLILLLAATTGMGILHATNWTIYVSQLHGLLIGLLLMLMLQYRSHVQNQQRQQAVVMLETSRLQTAHERSQREEQGRLLLMLAHELKTPLATMHLRLDQQTKGAAEIRQAMREMDAVIERCLQTVKTEGGHIAPQWQALDGEQLVRDAVSACSQPQRVRVRLQLPQPLSVVTDAQLAFIVLSNLLENACKYSAPGTAIDVRGAALDHADPPEFRLEVCNLPGTARWPDAAQVFDKYYRAPQAQRQSGTGLGLYLAQNLVRALGGRLTYEPDGTHIRFVWVLPVDAGQSA